MFVFDPTGILLANRIPNELQTVTQANGVEYIYITPSHAPFYEKGFTIVNVATGQPLTPGEDYELTHRYDRLSDGLAKEVFGSVTFMDPTINPSTNGNYRLVYQTVGGEFVTAANAAIPNGLGHLVSLRSLDWADIAYTPDVFPLLPHLTPVTSIQAVTEILNKMDALTASLTSAPPYIHMKDVKDLDKEWLSPVKTALTNIAHAITSKPGGADIYHEQATFGMTETPFNGATRAKWVSTGLAVTIQVRGTFMLNHDHVIKDADGKVYATSARLLIDGSVVDRSYSNHTTLGLLANMVVTLQIRMDEPHETVYLANTEHSTSMSVLRVSN